MTKLQEAYTQEKQSIWLDYIRRTLMSSGELQQLIDKGLRGMTSNPTIFAEAISESDDYDEEIHQLQRAGKELKQIYESLAIADIRAAADQFRPLYQESNYGDGYVSLEANPNLADDTDGTLSEVRRLWKEVDRPNVMIKVPATPAGVPAIATLLGEGININVTLMFSLAHYEAVADAYLQGIETLLPQQGNLERLASVASFFVSRVDTEVDAQLEKIGNRNLQGKIGIANAKMAYARYLNVFSSPRFQRLAKAGARPQRILFGSTSVKNPDYPEMLYVDNLMGANTVNTLPRATIKAMDTGATIASGITQNLEAARQQIVQLAEVGVDLHVITEELQKVGVRKFADSFQELFDAIEKELQQQEAREQDNQC